MPGRLPPPFFASSFLWSSAREGPEAPAQRAAQAKAATVLYDTTRHPFSAKAPLRPLDQSSRAAENAEMGLRLEPSSAVRERRLERLLADRGLARDDARLASLVEDALLVGSLELAGKPVSWEAARATRGTPAEPVALAALRRARAAVTRQSPVTPEAIGTWHECLLGPVGFRAEERVPGAPTELIADRLAELALWLAAEGGAALGPSARSALALARIVEIRPFDDGNGRVARLAAAHLMAQAGLAPPILVKGDAPRLETALAAAFRLETGPLVDLVDEASGRALAVMIQALERGLV